MARKKTTPASQTDQSENNEATQGGGQEGHGFETHGFAPGSSRKMSKTDAIRAAMAEGFESPGDGVDFIRKRFGIEMSKGHFSATKSKLKSSSDAVGAMKGGARKTAKKSEAQPVGD